MESEQAPALPTSAKAAATSCWKEKSEGDTFLGNLRDHINEFVHTSVDEHKACFWMTIQKMFGTSKVAGEKTWTVAAAAAGMETDSPLRPQTSVSQ